MLIDLKKRLREEEIRELLAWSVFPDPGRVDEVIERYEQSPDWSISGLEDDEGIVGLIGYRLRPRGELEVLHLAVIPEARGVGFGRLLLLETIERERPAAVVAEADEHTVEFFRHVGFVVESLGASPYGEERFRCVFATDYGGGPED
ncbi:MAG: hypothetical protein BAA02_13660 [Paenibacillaceae bacterium ZCTH02-B3]|nr:MAG: hypothetical protein BAA02_13660 [Paenibacillaceae bacterium ZCTH02-B3]